MNIVGRLKPGLTADTAKARLDVVYQQINEYELEDVPGFAAASQDVQGSVSREDSSMLHPAGPGLSDLRRACRRRSTC